MSEEQPTDKEALALLNDPADPLMLQSMGPAPEGGWQITTTGAHEVVLTMADAMAKMLDNNPTAGNYIEIKVKPAGEIDGYTLTIQRPKGKSPHQLRRVAEKARDRLLDVARDVVTDYGPDCCGSDDSCSCSMARLRSLVSRGETE